MKRKSKEPVRRSSRNRLSEGNLSSPESSSSKALTRTAQREPPSSKASARTAQRGKKRKSADDPEVTSPKVRPATSPKYRLTFEGNRKIDMYCWLCHKEAEDVVCNKCPRVYHEECLQKSHQEFNSSGYCYECQPHTMIKGISPPNIHRQRMRDLLKFAMQQSIKDDSKKNNAKNQTPTENPKFCRYFKTWPLDEITKQLCEIMDLDILIDKVNDDLPYRSCAGFFSDVKWIYHNCYILHGPDSEITELALKLERNFKQEMLDIEGCHQCYYTKHSEDYKHTDFFTRLCDPEHDLVWAKLRGSPYWPAKCLQIYNDHADVRFFGTHDKSVIPLNQCYRISRLSPNEKIKQSKYHDAITELSIYVSNSQAVNGCTYKYYECRTPMSEISTKKTPKRGRHRKRFLGDRLVNDPNVSEKPPSSEQLSETYEGTESGTEIVEDGRKPLIKELVQANTESICEDGQSSEFQENETHNLDLASTEHNASDPVVCMDFTADEEIPIEPLKSVCTETDITMEDGFSDTLQRNSIDEQVASPFVQQTSMHLNGSSEANSPVFVNSNVSNELPVITSAVSQDPSTSAVSMNAQASSSSNNSVSFPNVASTNAESVIKKLTNLVTRDLNGAAQNAAYPDEDDDVVVIGEKNPHSATILEILKKPLLPLPVCQMFLNSCPQLVGVLKKCIDYNLTTFVSMWGLVHLKGEDGTRLATLIKSVIDEKFELQRKGELLTAENEILSKRVAELEKFVESAKAYKGNAKQAIKKFAINYSNQKDARKYAGCEDCQAWYQKYMELEAYCQDIMTEHQNQKEVISQNQMQLELYQKKVDELEMQNQAKSEYIEKLKVELKSYHKPSVSVSVQTLEDAPSYDLTDFEDEEEFSYPGFGPNTQEVDVEEAVQTVETTYDEECSIEVEGPNGIEYSKSERMTVHTKTTEVESSVQSHIPAIFNECSSSSASPNISSRPNVKKESEILAKLNKKRKFVGLNKM